jgi:hypothetical protein
MADLFSQLGLPEGPSGINNFVAARYPLGNRVPIDCTPFWTEAQRTFLKEEIIFDADWVGVIDELNACLYRHSRFAKLA